MRFFNENNVEVKFCKPTKFKFISPFKKPYLVVDIFPKKVTRPYDLVNIGYDQLLDMGYAIFSIPAKNRKWYKSQSVFYIIAGKNISSPFANKLKNCPPSIFIQKDKGNKRIRLLGLNAGYPHRYESGGSGNWINYGNLE